MYLRPWIGSFCLFAGLIGSATLAKSSGISAQASLPTLPLHFEANVGQTDPSVAYLAHGSGYTMFFTPTESVLSLAAHGASPVAVRIQWLGTSAAARLSGTDPLSTVTKYLVGGDPGIWSKNVPNYGRVRYSGLYPGIDAVYYGKQGQLEYDLIVAPGADPSRARFRVQGAKALSVDPNGDLVIDLEGGQICQHHPVVYQEYGGHRREISSRYVLAGGTRVGFTLGGYNPDQPLVIDPVLTYSTYLGGTSEDKGSAIAVDGSGNAYITGTTSSQSFPGTKAQPVAISYAFLTKVSAAGDQIPFSYYIGGPTGYTQGLGVAVAGNNVYLTGITSSPDFFTSAAIKSAVTGSSDAYVIKMSIDGTAVSYSTLLGGSDGEFGYAITADADGNAYICGMTQSSDFPSTNGAQRTYGGGIADSFVAKLDSSGKLVFGTYIGGRGDDRASAIAVDSSRNVYLAGYTTSSDFPKALYQNLGAFAVKLSPDGSSFVYSLVFGASSAAQGIAVDTAGAAYMVGYSRKQNGWPAQPGGFQSTYGGGSNDAFVTKINPAGNALVYSTYLGGSGDESANAVSIDAAGNAYVAGETTSPNFPIVNGLQPQLAGAKNAFLAVLNSGGTALTYSTFLGGSGSDSATGIALGLSGSAYLTGFTNSLNFPTAHPLQSTLGGSNNAYNDAFVSRIDFNSGVPSGCSYTLDKSSLNVVAAGGSAAIQVTASNGCSWTADASAVSWVTITSATSGTGNGTVSLQISANSSTNSRTGTLTIAGNSVTITQAAASSTYQPAILALGDPSAVNLPAVTGPTLFYNYYSYRIDVPQNASRLVIDLSASQNVNLDLEVKFGADILLNDGTVVADYLTSGSGAVKHLIITPVSGSTIQVGSYYIGFLQNTAGQAVTGMITATVTTTAMSSAGTISLGNSGTGVLTSNSGRSVFYPKFYADTYQFTVANATTVSFTLSSSDFVPYLLIYDANGRKLGEMEPIRTADALVTCPFPAGTYWIEVSTTLRDATGRYTLQIAQAPQSNLAISGGGVTNSASFLNGGVAPGEIVTLFGINLGPAQLASLQVQNGRATTSLAGVRVLVNDVATPVISALSTQVSFCIPYSVQGDDWVEIQVEYQGNRSNYVYVPVVTTSPGLYTDGTGQAAALNEDSSINSASNPAQIGHYIVLYGTGQGQTAPAGVDGLITGSSLQYPIQQVTVRIGGVNAEVTYAGSAPGLIAGVLQINAKIPPGITTGSKVPVVFSAGNATSGGNATISIK